MAGSDGKVNPLFLVFSGRVYGWRRPRDLLSVRDVTVQRRRRSPRESISEALPWRSNHNDRHATSEL